MMKIGMVMIIIGDLLSLISIIIQIKQYHHVPIEMLIVALVEVVLTVYFIRIAKNMGYIFKRVIYSTRIFFSQRGIHHETVIGT